MRVVGLVRSVTAELFSRLPPGVAPRDEEEEREFDRAMAGSAVRVGRLLALILIAGTAAWWPIDWFFFRDQVFRINSIWRVGVIAACAFAAFAPSRLPLLTRRPLPMLVAVGIACVASMTYATSLLGGLEIPQFQFIHMTLFAVIFYPLRLVPRVATTLLFAFTELAVFFLPHPAYAEHPYFGPTLSMLGTTVALSVVLGEVVFRLRRRSFFQERALARRAAELDVVNAELEGRVRAQTSELRRLATDLDRTREAERTHVARELHDELGQELSALRFALALTTRRFERAPTSIGANLRELHGLLDRTAATTRDVVTYLRPRVLDDLGLTAAVEWQLQRTAARTSQAFDIDLRCRDELLSPATRIAAFRILQESLTNVERHAKAKRVAVSLATRDGALELEVRDDGVGLAARETERGSGLIGMRERAEALGGSLCVESCELGGTAVKVVLPCASTEAA